MNILFTRFPLESSYGGAEVQTLSLMQGLRDRGHEVRFLGSCPTLLKHARSCKLKAIRLNIGPPPVTKWGALSFVWRQRAMREKIIESIRPPHPKAEGPPSGPSPLPEGEGKVICMLSLSEKLLLTEWAVGQGIRVLWIEHDCVGRWLKWNPWLPKLRKLSKLATTICVSKLSRKIYRDLGWNRDRVVAIPNGIDLTHSTKRGCSAAASSMKKILRGRAQGEARGLAPACFTRLQTLDVRPKRKEEIQSPKSKVQCLRVGCIARLSWDKGIDLLIEAVADLPSVSLTIIGTGPEEQRLWKLIRRWNLSKRVTLQRTTNSLRDFYESLDIFVLPSREHDPFGLVAAEAMSLGVPVIVTDACGIAGYLHNKREAIVVLANSSLALSKAIQKLLHQAQRARLSREGETRAHDTFALEKMVRRYEEVVRRG